MTAVTPVEYARFMNFRILRLPMLLFGLVVLHLASPTLTHASSEEDTREIIERAYLEILEREPDARGLKTYERHLAEEGKDEVWLRDVLRNSSEGFQIAKKRKKRVAIGGCLVGAVLLIIIITLKRSDSSKEVCFKLLSILMAAVFACLVFEITLRVKSRRDAARNMEAWTKMGDSSAPADNAAVHLQHMIRMSPNPSIVYDLFPDMSVRFMGGRVHTDAQGFRVTPGSTNHLDAFRIVGLGDSVLFGWGVDDAETYLSRLVGPISQELDGRPVHVLNTSVPGYNTVMELETLKTKALQYSPNLVLIHYTENDLYLPNFIPKEDGEVRLTKSHLLAALSQWSGGKRATEPFERLVRRTSGDEPAEYKHMVGELAVQEAIKAMHRLSIEHDFKLVLVSNWKAKDFLRDVTDANGIPVIELGATLMDYCKENGISEFQGSVLTVAKKDPHFSALAHELVAEKVFSELERLGLLSE